MQIELNFFDSQFYYPGFKPVYRDIAHRTIDLIKLSKVKQAILDASLRKGRRFSIYISKRGHYFSTVRTARRPILNIPQFLVSL